MAISGSKSLTTLKTSASLDEGVVDLWGHPQVRRELAELLELLPERVDHLHATLGIDDVPLAIHARYTRREILGAFDVGTGVKPPTFVLIARLSVNNPFWCLGRATYVSHRGERPIAITWRLDQRLPGDLFAEFAAAVA